MGLFSSIFGGTSGKSDTLYKKAIDAFKSISTPELEALQVKLDEYVSAGTLTPEAAEAVLLNSNAFNDIKLDPSLQGAQKQALQQLQDIASSGGLTATDKARLNDIAIEQNTIAKGRNEAILQNARERGIGGSGLELTSQLLNEQEAANRASTQGTQVAADAEARALQALQAAGQLGGEMESRQYSQAANKAASQNAIDQFNAETQQATNMTNINARNQAQAANLANAQDIANKNTATQHDQAQADANAAQQDFQNKMSKASGIAGTYKSAADSAQQAASQEMGAEVGLVSGLIGGGASLLAKKAHGGMIEMPKDELIEEHKRLIPQLEGKEKKEQIDELEDIQNMVNGGKVPGKAPVKGDSEKNDIVPALLSPGEVVVPRTAVNDEEEFNNFMKNIKTQKLNCGGPVKKMAQGGPVPQVPPQPQQVPQAPIKAPTEAEMIAKALKSLQFRVTNLEGGK